MSQRPASKSVTSTLVVPADVGTGAGLGIDEPKYANGPYSVMSRLLAPRVDSIDAEANSFVEGNRPLKVLGEDGIFYIRGVMYRLGELVGAGGYGKVYKAFRDPQAPKHDERSHSDRISHLLNRKVIAAKLFRCDPHTKQYVPGQGKWANTRSARREMQLHARAQHYLRNASNEKPDGVISIIATTPVEAGATHGPLKVHRKWTNDEPAAHYHRRGGLGHMTVHHPNENWVLMAVEFAKNGSLNQWLNCPSVAGNGLLTDGADQVQSTKRKIQKLYDRYQVLPPPESAECNEISAQITQLEQRIRDRGHMCEHAAATTKRKQGILYLRRNPKIQEHMARCIILRLLLTVRRLHAAGILHLDLKLENVAVDANFGVRILDFGLARPMHDPKLQLLGGGTVGYYPPTERGRSEKSDVFALGVILMCLLTGCRNFLQHKNLMDKVLTNFMEQPRHDVGSAGPTQEPDAAEKSSRLEKASADADGVLPVATATGAAGAPKACGTQSSPTPMPQNGEWTPEFAGITLNRMLAWVRTQLDSNEFDPYFPLHDLSNGAAFLLSDMLRQHSQDRLTIEECIVKHRAWLLHDHASDDNRFSKFASELMVKIEKQDFHHIASFEPISHIAAVTTANGTAGGGGAESSAETICDVLNASARANSPTTAQQGGTGTESESDGAARSNVSEKHALSSNGHLRKRVRLEAETETVFVQQATQSQDSPTRT